MDNYSGSFKFKRSVRLSFIMDAGEASAIALAFEYKDVILIIDALKHEKKLCD